MPSSIVLCNGNNSTRVRRKANEYPSNNYYIKLPFLEAFGLPTLPSRSQLGAKPTIS